MVNLEQQRMHAVQVEIHPLRGFAPLQHPRFPKFPVVPEDRKDHRRIGVGCGVIDPDRRVELFRSSVEFEP